MLYTGAVRPRHVFRSLVNMAVGAGKRKVKVSKNKKKSWNRHCDVKDVEEFLEEERFNERIGGAVSEKKSEELFFVQTETAEPVVSIKIQKPLKCHQNIGAFSNVAPPVNVDVNRYPKKIKTALERAAEKKFKKLLAQTPKSRKHLEQESQCGNFTPHLKDLWADEKEVDSEIKDLITFRDEYTKKRTPNVPCHRFQKPSLLPAVEVPHAGASYNPTYDDHQALLYEAVNAEEKLLKDELHLKRVLTDMFPSKDDAPTQESILAEMSQGLFEEPDEDDAEPSDYFMLRNPPVSADDRLPKSRKRKRKELKEEARKRAVEKLHRQRLHQIYRLPSLKSEIRKEQQVSEKRQSKRLQEKIDKMYNPRTLSKHKYEAPDIEVNLTEELTGSLRTLKADGNLLEDRYKSLQRRNLIEPRIKQKMKRKYKLKKQVKRSHRNFE